MNTKGVEDGTDAKQRVLAVYPDVTIARDHHSAYYAFTRKGAGGRISEYVGSEELVWKSAAAKLPKPAELELKGEGGEQTESGLSKVFGTWPGEESDAQLLSALDEVRGAAVPVEERKTVEMFCEEELWERHSQTMEVIECDMREERSLMKRKDFSAALDEFINSFRPAPERTAEVEQYIGWARYVRRDEWPTRLVLCDSDAEGAFKIYRSIEGKAKAVSQEVKESCDCRKLCGCSIASKPHCHYCRFGMESK